MAIFHFVTVIKGGKVALAYHVRQWSYWTDIYVESRWHRNKYVWNAICTMLISFFMATIDFFPTQLIYESEITRGY